MTDPATVCQPPSEIYHGSEVIPIGRRFDPSPRLFYLFVSSSQNYREKMNIPLPPSVHARPYEPKEVDSNRRANSSIRYKICMSKPSETREKFVLDELFNSRNLENFPEGFFLAGWVAESVVYVLCYMWEGSSTVVYTVVWGNSVVWREGGNTALWLVRKRIFLVYTQVWITRLCVPLQPITAPCFPLLIKPGNFAKRQCKLQWMTTPPIYASRKIQGLILNQGRVYPVLNP